MFPDFKLLLLVSVLAAALLSGANPNPTLPIRADSDYEQVSIDQRDILDALQAQVQNIIPELWQLTFTSGDPSSQLAQIETLYLNAGPAIANTTVSPVPAGTEFLQTDFEFQVGMELIRPICDIVDPLARFERTDAFLALTPALESAFVNLIQGVAGTWEDLFISDVATGLVTGLEFDALRDLNMFGVVVVLGLTA